MYKTFWPKHIEEKNPFKAPVVGLDGITILKRFLKEKCEVVEWIHLGQSRDR
jgi:hypothetical protein